MADLRFTHAAEADLADIDESSAFRFGEGAATAYMLSFDEAFARLSAFPRSGQVTPEVGADIRCLVHQSHRIAYRMHGEDVLVLRVLHHAQDARAHLKS